MWALSTVACARGLPGGVGRGVVREDADDVDVRRRRGTRCCCGSTSSPPKTRCRSWGMDHSGGGGDRGVATDRPRLPAAAQKSMPRRPAEAGRPAPPGGGSADAARPGECQSRARIAACSAGPADERSPGEQRPRPVVGRRGAAVRSVTTAPASRAIRSPAATSHSQVSRKVSVASDRALGDEAEPVGERRAEVPLDRAARRPARSAGAELAGGGEHPRAVERGRGRWRRSARRSAARPAAGRGGVGAAERRQVHDAGDDPPGLDDRQRQRPGRLRRRGRRGCRRSGRR